MAIRDGSADLGQLNEQVGIAWDSTPQEKRSAALTTAEAAIAGGWSRDQLADTLDALGLTEQAAS